MKVQGAKAQGAKAQGAKHLKGTGIV